jgi:hypothetical protein
MLHIYYLKEGGYIDFNFMSTNQTMMLKPDSTKKFIQKIIGNFEIKKIGEKIKRGNFSFN